MEEAGRNPTVTTARSKGDARGQQRPVVTVNVADEKTRAADRRRATELHYLATVLQRDRAMDPTSVVCLQPRLGHSEDELLKAGGPRTTLPEGRRAGQLRLRHLGDVSPEQLPGRRQRIRRRSRRHPGAARRKQRIPLGYPLQEASGAAPPGAGTSTQSGCSIE
jgi:hypothetical protein